MLEQVFEPFFRLESSRNADTGGVGLGLSIARDIAQAHGGSLTLRNRIAARPRSDLALTATPPASARARLQFVTIAYSLPRARCLQCLHGHYLEDHHMRALKSSSDRCSRIAAGANRATAGAAARRPVRLERLAILLDLDAYQKGEVERVLKEQREAMRAEREAQRAAREANDGAATGERPSRDELQARRDESRDAVFGQAAEHLERAANDEAQASHAAPPRAVAARAAAAGRA